MHYLQKVSFFIVVNFSFFLTIYLKEDDNKTIKEIVTIIFEIIVFYIL